MGQRDKGGQLEEPTVDTNTKKSYDPPTESNTDGTLVSSFVTRCLHQHLPQAIAEDSDVDVVTDEDPVVDLDEVRARTRKPSGESCGELRGKARRQE